MLAFAEKTPVNLLVTGPFHFQIATASGTEDEAATERLPRTSTRAAHSAAVTRLV
jgi:hypothetical protein